MNEMDPKEYSVLESSGLLQNLLEKHTGRLEDVRDVIGSDTPKDLGEFKVDARDIRGG